MKNCEKNCGRNNVNTAGGYCACGKFVCSFCVVSTKPEKLKWCDKK